MMKNNSIKIILWGILSVAPMSIFAAANNVHNQIENLGKQPNTGVAEQALQQINTPPHQNSLRAGSEHDDGYSSDDCPTFSEEGYWFLVFAGCIFATQRKS